MQTRRIILWTVLGVVAAVVLTGIVLVGIFVYQLVTGPTLFT